MRRSKLIKGAIVLLPILLFVGLLGNYLGWSGEKTIHYVVGDSSPFVQSLLPDTRVSKSENGSVKLLDEPVYFSVFAPPGNWQTADVKISFKTGSRAILELGALKDLFAQAYDFRPLANTVVENLEAKGWVAKELSAFGEHVYFFIRQELHNVDPATIRDSEVAVYRAALPWAMPKGATIMKKENVYVLPLQGPHELYTVIGDGEPLKLTIKLRDLNQAIGSDEGVIRIYTQSGEQVGQEVFADDGDMLGDSVMAAARAVTIAPDGLPAGVYRIVLSATSDIVFDEFKTKQKFLLVRNSLTLAEHKGVVALNTNAKKISVEPLTAKGLGSVTFGGSKIVLNEVKGKVAVTSIDRETSAIILPGSNIKITGEGFFALANAGIYSPEAAGFSNFLAAEDTFKILAAYVPPESKEGDWRVASSTFNLVDLAKERGAYKFVLSAPLVKEKDGDVEIHAVDITFKKPAMTLRLFLSSLKSFAKDLIW